LDVATEKGNMRIAQVAPLIESVPPKHYGGTERIVSYLTEDLLQTTLDEESETNELLNRLAEDIVNPEALMEPELVGASSDR
jgi:hypothetical protein